MSKKFKVACIQLNTKQSIDRNLRHLLLFIKQAIKNKSQLIVTPETSNLMSLKKKELLNVIRTEEKDIFLHTLKEISKKERVWILIGSLIILDEKKKNSKSFLSD